MLRRWEYRVVRPSFAHIWYSRHGPWPPSIESKYEVYNHMSGLCVSILHTCVHETWTLAFISIIQLHKRYSVKRLVHHAVEHVENNKLPDVSCDINEILLCCSR